MPDAHAKVDPNDPFFVRLRQLRDDAGTPTYREIAARAGMSVSTANNVLRGHNIPRWDLVRAILAALGGGREEFRPLYDQMLVRARARGDRDQVTSTPGCPGCGCYIASEVVHALACGGNLLTPPRPSKAPPISADSWLQREEYADFRAGYAYAAAHGLPALPMLDPEDTYYIWATINRGIERACGDYPAPCNCDDPRTHDLIRSPLIREPK